MNKCLGNMEIARTGRIKWFNMPVMGSNDGEKETEYPVLQYKWFLNDKTITCVIWDGMCKHIGIATCHPNDTYDENIGMAVAEMRAVSQYYNNIAKAIVNEFCW